MILYFDGDSFIAGTELADDILPEHPGYLPYDAPEYLRNKNNNWINRTYNGDLRKYREEYKDKIDVLEKERCFANKIAKKSNYQVVNASLGGSSIETIGRRTITNLLKLKQQSSKIIAFIGTTDIWRSEIPYVDSDWVSVQPGSYWYENAKSVIDYKVMYEKNYHGLVRFYKNIIAIKDFCRVNNIEVYFIETVTGVSDWKIETEYAERDDYVTLKNYTNFGYLVSMKDIAMTCGLPDVLCPSFHFSESVHNIVADKILETL